TTIDRDSETSLRGVNLKALLDDSYNFSTWVKPPSGKFSTLADIRGALLSGTVADIVRESCAYENAGANHIVYDLRLRFTDCTSKSSCWAKKCSPHCGRNCTTYSRLECGGIKRFGAKPGASAAAAIAVSSAADVLSPLNFPASD